VFVAVIAQFSIFNTYIASGSRGFFALAEDNLAPRVLVKCSAGRGVPYVAVLSLGIFSLVVCMFPFKVIVVVDMVLLMGAYALIFIAACILRVRERGLARPFKVPFGTAGFVAMCVPPLFVTTVALFVNGTDYFVGGMIALVTGPIAYCVFRRAYGGLTAVDPVRHPANPRTGLALGDTRRMASMFAGMAVAGLIGIFFLPWYDDPQIYAENYGVDGFFAILMQAVRWMTAISAALALALAVLARRIEPRGADAPTPF
jgi:hypothetical protein